MNHDNTNPDETTDVDERDVRALTECQSVLDDVGRARRADDLYLVVGQSGREYLVDARVGACECDDFQYRVPEGGCKHVRRVAFATGDREIPEVLADEVDELLGIHVDGAETDGGAAPMVTDGGVVSASDGGANLPSGWRQRETAGASPDAWDHEPTGLTVRLHKYGRYYQPGDALPDHYEYRLVVSVDGERATVDRCTVDFETGHNRDRPVEMAIEWIREHPDGEADLDAEELDPWEGGR